jgi:2-C-methyl-D-erythritol 4-phosphate cytidylyltransferase
VTAPRLHALIPAAGTGARLGADMPKQYLVLGDRTMLEHAIDAMLADLRIDRVLVVVAPGDARVASLGLSKRSSRVATAPVGGASRADSVRAGLDALAAHGAAEDDWVLVHDAARPCLAADELRALVDALADDAVGGLLAQPLVDTLKRADAAADAPRVQATVDRARLWRAATPQMFRLATLRRALDAPGIRERATDEASAVEALGLAPRLIACSATNLKVTTAADVPLARAILQAQGRLASSEESHA